jgi:bacterial leucyl aminopeptidase
MTNTNDHGGIAAVFFDLGDTLGTATVGGQPPQLIRFDVFPFIPGVLADLQAQGLRLGVISNTGGEKAPAMNAVLQPTGLLARLDPALLVYSADEGVTKASPEIFNRAATRTGQSAGRCLFVGEDAAERAVAASTRSVAKIYVTTTYSRCVANINLPIASSEIFATEPRAGFCCKNL